MPKNDEHLKSLRSAELETVRSYFLAGARVLEIGGGNGWQAQLISQWGCSVTSVDVDPAGSWARTYFPVLPYDGRRLPFASGTFDIIFSSNVLEHVTSLPELLVEMRRVLKSGGVAIHLVPTPSWRVWTSLTHYPHLLRKVLAVAAPRSKSVATSNGRAPPATKLPVTTRLVRWAFAEPHGTSSSALREVYEFSRRRWIREFESAGFRMTAAYPTGVFYSGYALLPFIGMAARRRLSRVAGSSCSVYVMS